MGHGEFTISVLIIEGQASAAQVVGILPIAPGIFSAAGSGRGIILDSSAAR